MRQDPFNRERTKIYFLILVGFILTFYLKNPKEAFGCLPGLICVISMFMAIWGINDFKW